MIQDGLYSRFAKHVETVCLENPRQFQKVAPHVRGKNRPDTLFPHEGNVLCRDQPRVPQSNNLAKATIKVRP